MSNKVVPGSRTRQYATIAGCCLVASYVLAHLGVTSSGDPMGVWYVIMSLGSGILGAFMTVATLVHHFDWE